MSDFAVILFNSTSQSLWTARLLKKAGIDRKMVPIPRTLSADCGYCVRIRTEDIGKAREALTAGGIEYREITELV
jgi:hypothetical protein